MADPLVVAIEAFIAGSAAYSATPDVVTSALEQEVINCTYGPPLAVLHAWTEPAQTLEGVEAALRLVCNEGFMSDLQEALLTAALAYFDRQEVSHAA